MSNVMLISPDEVKTSSQVNYNFDESVLGAAIRTAQNIYLTDIIGVGLVTKLQTLVYNAIKGLSDSIEDASNADYKTLLDEYVTPFLVAKTQVECCIQSSFQIRNMGIVQDSDTNVRAAALSDIKYVKDYYDTQSCTYATSLSKYVAEHKSSYPEAGKCFKAKEYANTGLWLGKGRR